MVSGKNHRLVDIKTLEELRQGWSLGTREACGIKKSGSGTMRKHTV